MCEALMLIHTMTAMCVPQALMQHHKVSAFQTLLEWRRFLAALSLLSPMESMPDVWSTTRRQGNTLFLLICTV